MALDWTGLDLGVGGDLWSCMNMEIAKGKFGVKRSAVVLCIALVHVASPDFSFSFLFFDSHCFFPL